MPDVNPCAVLIAPSPLLRPGAVTPEFCARVQSAQPGWEVISAVEPGALEGLTQAQAARVRVIFGLPPEAHARFENLEWVQLTSAGADRALAVPGFKDSPARLTNLSGVHAHPISEHILAFMLALARDLPASLRLGLERRWSRAHPVEELAGSTLGLIGLGAIGSMTAHKAKALGMRVLGLRRTPQRSDPNVDEMFGPPGLEELLRRADWVVLAAAATPETKGLIGARELSLMKPTARLINIARGALVDEAALVQALKSGQIAAAGLDVFEREPLPADSPLWEMENVIITAHYAGSTPHYMERALDIFTRNLKRFAAGRPLVNQVDKALGY